LPEKGNTVEKICSRRMLLTSSAKGAAALFLVSTLGTTLLSACKKNSNKAPDKNKEDPPALACEGEDKLNDQEKAIRASLKYVDQSPLPDRRCDNCKLYTLPVGKALCGGCKILPGPVHPKGHCTAWIQQM